LNDKKILMKNELENVEGSGRGLIRVGFCGLPQSGQANGRPLRLPSTPFSNSLSSNRTSPTAI
jgi:hypothetical protein